MRRDPRDASDASSSAAAVELLRRWPRVHASRCKSKHAQREELDHIDAAQSLVLSKEQVEAALLAGPAAHSCSAAPLPPVPRSLLSQLLNTPHATDGERSGRICSPAARRRSWTITADASCAAGPMARLCWRAWGPPWVVSLFCRRCVCRCSDCPKRVVCECECVRCASLCECAAVRCRFG